LIDGPGEVNDDAPSAKPAPRSFRRLKIDGSGALVWASLTALSARHQDIRRSVEVYRGTEQTLLIA
jgi:hypothetical protein